LEDNIGETDVRVNLDLKMQKEIVVNPKLITLEWSGMMSLLLAILCFRLADHAGTTRRLVAPESPGSRRVLPRDVPGDRHSLGVVQRAALVSLC
jgi:hypothetical protein